jgi:hypothetical protein
VTDIEYQLPLPNVQYTVNKSEIDFTLVNQIAAIMKLNSPESVKRAKIKELFTSARGSARRVY